MPIETIGVIVLVVLVVVAVAIFFFAGLSEQGGVISRTSDTTVGGLDTKLNSALCGIGDVVEGDGLCCINYGESADSPDCVEAE